MVAIASLLAITMIFPASAQEGATQAERFSQVYDMYETKVIVLEHVRPSSVLKLMANIFDDDMLTADDDLNAILMMAPKPLSESIEAAIKLLDAPQDQEEPDKNVELTVRLIQGSGLQTNDEVDADWMPDSLEPVIAELNEIFTYDNYHLVDTLFIRCRDGSEASTSGMLPSGTSDSEEAVYDLRIDRVSATYDHNEPYAIRLDDVSFSATMPHTIAQSGSGGGRPTRIERREVGIRADIDLREGQQVVVGKASLSSSDMALFVVISAKVVES
jgi:hypothetical protein